MKFSGATCKVKCSHLNENEYNMAIVDSLMQVLFLVKFDHKSTVKECINCSTTTTSIMKILVQIDNSHHLRNLVKHDDHSIYGTLDIVF